MSVLSMSVASFAVTLDSLGSLWAEFEISLASLGMTLESLGMPFESFLEASCGVLGASPLRGPGGFVERYGCLGGTSWGLLEAVWGHLGGLLGPFLKALIEVT